MEIDRVTKERKYIVIVNIVEHKGEEIVHGEYKDEYTPIYDRKKRLMVYENDIDANKYMDSLGGQCDDTISYFIKWHGWIDETKDKITV